MQGERLSGWPGVSEPLEGARLIALSLGAGVQSSTLALMAARGDVKPMPDVAFFADTGWEPVAVYRWLEWLKTQLPFPVVTVSRKGPNLGDFAIEQAAQTDEDVPRGALPPWFTDEPWGMLPLQCSKEFKTRPITLAIRERLGLKRRERGPAHPVVEQWIGMSTDELERLKRHEQAMIRNRWPLVELKMNRADCITWMAERQYPRPPKSSCIFCPMRDQGSWVRMKAEAPEDFARAVAFDKAIRRGFAGMEGSAYVHRQRVPLDQADLTVRGGNQVELIECEGMCGV